MTNDDITQKEKTIKIYSIIAGFAFLIMQYFLYFLLAVAIGQFGETFDAFGDDDLPLLTVLFVKYRYYLCLIALFSSLQFISYFIVSDNEFKNKNIWNFIRLYSVVFFIMVLVVIVAMYLPIFYVGKVI